MERTNLVPPYNAVEPDDGRCGGDDPFKRVGGTGSGLRKGLRPVNPQTPIEVLQFRDGTIPFSAVGR